MDYIILSSFSCSKTSLSPWIWSYYSPLKKQQLLISPPYPIAKVILLSLMISISINPSINKTSVSFSTVIPASNVDAYEKNHDELDIEFLGNIKGKPWRFQTNMYGNGSLSRGREERYRLWSDPTKEFHRYSILWTPFKVIFYVDEIPIRDIIRNDAMGSDYPAKPMSMYATIWDASTWATNGGKNKVDYTFEPFSAEFQDFVIQGCAVDPIQQISATNCTDTALKLTVSDYFTVKPHQRLAMQRFREKYMYYSHSYDYLRYPVPQPECGVVPSEQKLFKESGRLREAMKMKFGGSHRRHRRGRNSRRRSRGGPVGLVSGKEVGEPWDYKEYCEEALP